VGEEEEEEEEAVVVGEEEEEEEKEEEKEKEEGDKNKTAVELVVSHMVSQPSAQELQKGVGE
jgi:hypothetical protein